MTAAKRVARPTARFTPLVDDGIVTVTAAGQVGSSAAAFLQDRLRDACDVCIGVLAVDLSACTYLSDDAVEVLHEALKRSPRGRYRLQITAAHRDIAEALDAAGIPRLDSQPAAPHDRTGHRRGATPDGVQAGIVSERRQDRASTVSRSRRASDG